MNSILITGGSRGIGRATVLLCGARGWAVTFNYIEGSVAANDTQAALEASGAQSHCVKANIAKERDVISMFDVAVARFGVVTGVVLNAGVVAPSLELADMSDARLKKMFAVNIYGTFLCAREAARRMSIKRGGAGGSIVIVSSAANRIGSPFEYVDYAASKAALDTLGLGLSKELAQEGVRVNVVRPGIVDTQIHASAGQPDRAHQLGALTPLGRPGRASEIAEAIVWLLSDAASYVTGSIIDVAGGR